MPRRILQSRRGAAIVAIIMVMLLMNLIIIGMVLGGARDQSLMINQLDTERAFYAAESGISLGLREAFLGSDIDGDGSVGSISDDGNSGNDPQVGPSRVWVESVLSGGRTTLIARASSGGSSRRLENEVAPDTNGTAPGLWAEYFTSASTVNSLSDIDWTASPTETIVATQINFAETSGQGWPSGATNNWGRRYTGKITIPQAGNWTLYTNSDDGSSVWIDNSLVVNNDNTHSMQTRSGSVVLGTGQHDIEIRWFERTGVFGLHLYWSGPGVASQTLVPPSALSH